MIISEFYPRETQLSLLTLYKFTFSNVSDWVIINKILIGTYIDIYNSRLIKILRNKYALIVPGSLVRYVSSMYGYVSSK